MKKIICTMLSVILLLSVFCNLGGCGASENRDETKTQLDISFFAGGFGDSWITQMKNEFEEKYKDYSFEEGKKGVQVWLKTNKDSQNTIFSDMKTGTSTTLYFTASSNIRKFINAGLVEDISDVWQRKPDGEGGKKLVEKLVDVEDYEKIYNVNGSYYAVPFTRAVIGFVFDYQLFVDNGWLYYADDNDKTDLTTQGYTYSEETGDHGEDLLVMTGYTGTAKTKYEVGDILLKAGKDGVFGTYDDGQPQDVDEWDEMILKINSSANTKPFLFSRTQVDYVDPIAEAVFAQYDGIENYEISYTYDGTYTRPSNGETISISLANGYENYGFEGRSVALDFLKKNVANSSYKHPSTGKTSKSQMDVQVDYVLGYRKTNGNPTTGLFIEGIWWENETKYMFDAIANEGEKDRGYGKREYRYMLLPYFEGQKGIDGDGNGSVMSAFDIGEIFVNKNSSKGSKDAAKEFIVYTSSDDSLKKFTSNSGNVRPFIYDLSEAEYNGLTPFQQNVWDIYSDTKNVRIVNPNLLKYCQEINWNASKQPGRWTTKYNGIEYTNVMNGLGLMSASEYLTAAKDIYTSSVWASMLGSIVS